MNNLDWGKLQQEDLVGRKVWVEGVIAANVNGGGNVEISFSTNINGTVAPHTSAFVHTSTIKELLEPDLEAGDRVRWAVPSSTLTDTEGDVLWSDGEHVLVRWDGEPEPAVEMRENVRAVSRST